MACVDSLPYEPSGPSLWPPSSLVDTAYKYTSAEILIDYGFSLGSYLYCSTEDIDYVFAFTENGAESPKNSIVTIDTDSK